MKKSLICTTALLVVALTTSANAAVLTAETAPNFKVVIDGVAKEFKDANGNKVDPVIINGTTYLPLRPIADAFGKEVSWDGTTSTISIGENVGNVSVNLIDVLSAKARDEKWNTDSRYVSKVSGEASLTFANIGDVGAKFQSAIKVSDINSAKKEGSFELSGSYKTLSCTLLYVPSVNNKPGEGVTVQITNADTGVDVINQAISANELVQMNDVDISGLTKMLIAGHATTIEGKDGVLYILNPVVK